MQDYLLRRDAFRAGRLFFLVRGRYLDLRMQRCAREQDYQDVFGAALKYELTLLHLEDGSLDGRIWANGILQQLRRLVAELSTDYNRSPPRRAGPRASPSVA